MSTGLEIERKFLIKFPPSWSSLAELLDGLVDVKRISQTYLEPEEGEQSARVRKTIAGLSNEESVEYHYNKKKFVEKGVNEEIEHGISKEKYNSMLKKEHHDKFTVQKIRFVFDYQDQIFELDIFKGPLKGLAILEIELKNKADKVTLPPFLNIIKEVTNEPQYNNFNLATKSKLDLTKSLIPNEKDNS